MPPERPLRGSTPQFTVRPATTTDLAAINAIYNHYVATSPATFDLEPVSESARREDPEVTTRSIYRVAVEETPELLTFEIEGSGFLYKMVRLITGSLVHMARGRDSEDWFRDLLHNPAGEKSNQCALPDGLYLVRVNY